jgi:hypothetical protein
VDGRFGAKTKENFLGFHLAATASVLSILHSALGVPAKIKEEEQRRQQFSALHDFNSENNETLFQNACRQM